MDDKWLGGWDDRSYFTVPTGQWPWEILTVVDIVKSRLPTRIVEIGCLYGGTLKLWLECLVDRPEAIVLGIDPEIDKVREYVNDKRLMLFKGISANEKAIHAAESLSQLDVLFIDGDHSYEGARYDFFRYGRMVKKGGLILLHDIVTFRQEVGVPKLWEEIKLIEEFQTDEIIGKHEPELGGGIGIVYT